MSLTSVAAANEASGLTGLRAVPFRPLRDYPRRQAREAIGKGAAMKLLECLRCSRRSLVSTGAFWACGTCGYAITQAALLAEQPRSLTKNQAATLGGHSRSKPTP